jgi:hypothetical protein
MADTELIKKSVTKGDYPDNPREAIWNFIVPFGGSTLSAGALPPEPPYYWTVARDLLLRSTPLYEDMWAGAVQIATVKATALAWEVDSEVPLRAKRAQELLLDSNWVQFIAKHIRDYLTTDNGTFVEVVRATSSASSRIMGIVHLDSLRCTRTGDPDIPVIYRDKMGREHEMKSHQVFMMSDLPDPGEMFFGVGLCAASRSYRAIYKLHVMDRYIGEKVSGRRPLAIHFVNAVGPRQLESVVVAAEENAARQGILSYMGAIVVPLLDADKPPEVSTIPLAELPDRFNRKEEFDIALLTYADNIGLDPQDLQPLTGQALGTGAQSAVLDEKSKGRVLATWRQEFTHNINEYLLDELTSFAFVEHDYRDMERKAGISNQRADASKKRIEAGITTPAQELQVLVDDDELPKEFLPEDATGDSLSDTEKPDQEAAEQAEGQDEELPEEQPEAEPKPDETPAKAETKEIALKFAADQPRAPKGDPQGGQWVKATEGGGRAPKGGIVGINNEFYPGGTFLPNTNLPKMTPEEKRRSKNTQKKQEIEPYKYDVPPSPDHRSIFKRIGGTVATYDRSTGTLSKVPNQKTLDYFTPGGKVDGIDLDDLILQYNSGMRWYLPMTTKEAAETKALQEIGELIAQEQDEAQDLYRKAIGEE